MRVWVGTCDCGWSSRRYEQRCWADTATSKHQCGRSDQPRRPTEHVIDQADRDLRGLIYAITNDAMRRHHLPEHLRDDVTSDAAYGVAQAAANYDPTRGSWAPHAWRRGQGAIIDGLRSRGHLSRKYAGTPDAELPPTMRRPLPLESTTFDGTPILDLIPSGDGGITAAETRHDLHQALAVLTPLERTVMLAHYIEGATQTEIAAARGVTGARICQIIHKALHKARAAATTPSSHHLDELR